MPYSECWVIVDCHRVTARWHQWVGQKADGRYGSVSGISILYYTGEGIFCCELFIINVNQLDVRLRAMKWRPPSGANWPPKEVCRDTSLPNNWTHLEKP